MLNLLIYTLGMLVIHTDLLVHVVLIVVQNVFFVHVMQAMAVVLQRY